MKTLARFVSPLIFATALAAAPVDFHQHLGLQLWSLRAQTKESTTGALDLAKSYGIVEIETAGTGNLTVEQFAAELKSRGLHAVGVHLGYDDLKKDVGAAIATAKTFGAKFIVCPWIPHPKEGFSIEQAHQVAADFNKWGKAIHEAGLQLGWHPHGFEFVASPSGETPFDVVVKETSPATLALEMDVFWVFHAGQDPAKLLAKYPDRWALLHVKDIRKGAITGLSSGSAPPTDNVTVGSGQIDWPSVLGVAQQIGVQYYLIEDETPAPLQCIPASLAYLRRLKL